MNHVIAALDGMDLDEAVDFARRLPLEYVKIGPRLFFKHGHQALHKLGQDKRIFLDLKLHDIPNTVAEAIKALAGLPIEFLTIHLAGGPVMISKACQAAARHLPDTTLLGVSYLTSLGEAEFSRLWNLSGKQALELMFRAGLSAGIEGMVLSAQDIALLTTLEAEAGRKVLKVCPGIRFADEPAQDQKRVQSPAAARAAGADYLVIGRSLTCATNLQARLAQLKT